MAGSKRKPEGNWYRREIGRVYGLKRRRAPPGDLFVVERSSQRETSANVTKYVPTLVGGWYVIFLLEPQVGPQRAGARRFGMSRSR
jgi:hypothetical protein